MLRNRTLKALAFSFGATALAGSANAQFTSNTTDIPTSGAANNSWSENVDFGDIDLDGDWDAAWADGGDANNDQNRVWINMGGLQGGTLGVFEDQTNARFPSILDDGRDVEFVDFDGDGDLDMYNSNTSAITNQTNRWWSNNGGAQGGTLGFYTDDTATRWVGLGVNGLSSIPPGGVLPGGGFIDWSCDCDFGDLDNDGDMDLVHSTYGGSFVGGAPTRIYMNDGDGFFTEFNPTNFVLSSDAINNGDPALWAQGTQSANTTNSNGSFADIATSTLDIDLGDQDGDFDLDILHGDRNNDPRFFYNWMEENGGVFTRFRDVGGAIYPNQVLTNNGGSNYEQEMADIDGDGDLDLYGLNWQGFTDKMYRNNNGTFGDTVSLSNSGADDNEGDFLDYDNDGDLDLFVCNFSGSSKLYRNDDTGSGTPNFTYIGTQPGGGRNIDADAADVDGDGDYDVFVARDSNNNTNRYLENTTNTPDTHGPYIPNVEDPGNQTAGTSPTVVRAQVYDNAPYYIIWYNETEVDVTVDGSTFSIPAQSSQGNIFRAEIPGNLDGAVSFTWRSQDEYGNSGSSAATNYTASTGLSHESSYGPSTTSVSTGNAPVVDALSVGFPGTTLYIGLRDMAPGSSYFLSLNSASANIPLPGLLHLNVGGTNYATLTGVADGSGEAVLPFPLSGTTPSGASIFWQVFTLDTATNGDLLSSSQGLQTTTQ